MSTLTEKKLNEFEARIIALVKYWHDIDLPKDLSKSPSVYIMIDDLKSVFEELLKGERKHLKQLFPKDGKYDCWREGDEVFCADIDSIKIGTEITTKEAASILGITDRHVRRLIKEGKIKAVRRDEKEWKVIKERLND